MLLQQYTDSYEKLTEKTFSGIRWAYYNCILIQYILIADDDVYIKTKQLIPEIKMMDVSQNLGHIDVFDENENTRQISPIECIGKYVTNARTTRQGKWGVGYESWPGDFYLPYCEGACYMLRRDALNQIFKSSGETNMDFPIDDIFFTGIIREKVGLGLSERKTRFDGMCEHISNKLGEDAVIQAMHEKYQYDMLQF